MTGPLLVTGATGFVGRTLIGTALNARVAPVRAVVRDAPQRIAADVQTVCIPDIGATADWSDALRGVDTVLHLAARVHVMHETERDPLAAFRRVNLDGTLALARAAAAAGVRRFVFLSSIKVNGEHTERGKPFTTADPPRPQDPYGTSKLEAELGLGQIAANSALEVVIVRSPLVYGPGVKGNFRSMMQWLVRGVPLPLGAIHNRRSLVGLDNLVDLLLTCVQHPAAANQTFLAADGEDLSTTELLQRLGRALEHPARLIPIPAALLQLAAAMVGRRDMALRLCESLQVDVSTTRTLLGWKPPVAVDQGLRQTARDFLTSRAAS